MPSMTKFQTGLLSRNKPSGIRAIDALLQICPTLAFEYPSSKLSSVPRAPPGFACSSKQLMSLLRLLWLILSTVSLGILFFSCQGSDYGVLQPNSENLCNCLPIEPDIADYRHLAKHVAILNMTPVEISVDTILGWPEVRLWSS